MAGRRAADWRFPTPKQARAEETARRMAESQRRRAGVTDEDACWAAVLAGPRAETRRPRAARTLADIRSTELRVECLKCFRTVTLTGVEALQRYGPAHSGRRSPLGSSLSRAVR